MAIAITLILLVVGSVLFHFLSPWWFTPIASNWETMDQTVNLTFWVTGAVFVAINLFMAYSIIRYRHREGQKAHYEPENKKLEWVLTIVTAVGVVAMLAPGLFVWAQFINVPKDAAIVEVVAQQWHWSFRLPGADGELGTTNARLISDANPFGMSPDDPNGQDDVLVSDPELHLPLNRPVKLLLRSKDVLHNFTVAQFRVKMDMVPGMISYMWLTPTRTGEYEILCEELCGIAHFAMRGRVVVDDENGFRTWLAANRTYATISATAPADTAAGATLYAACAACHGASGEGNAALNAPKLAGQESWYLQRQLRNFKQGMRGAQQNDIYGVQMVAITGILTDETAVRNVVAYIQTLPDQKPPATVLGNVGRGAVLYQTCAACHGKSGQGIEAMDAPRLSQMSDWYLARQLQNFKDGIRGSHHQDYYGKQMAMITGAVADAGAINNLVAHINTLQPAGTQIAMANRRGP
jgi:cytochrome c oxidase subunit II